jgi:hypothetical protein
MKYLKVIAGSAAAPVALAIGAHCLAASHYVDLNSANPTPPYTNWATAATVIQDAVDAATAGDEVVVTDGLYATGGRPVGADPQTNRVAVDKSLTLRSVNGPQVTIIQGHQATNYGGADSFRCVYLGDGVVLSGFTLTNGAADSGGGVYCATANALVTNCVLVGNIATAGGGGVAGGTVRNCSLVGNRVVAQFYEWTFLSGVFGGGACGCALYNCTLMGNSAVGYEQYYLDLAGNILFQIGGAQASGGGAYGSSLYNCTLTANGRDTVVFGFNDFGYSFPVSDEESGDLADSCMLNNCIAYPNYTEASVLNYCCTGPMIPADGFGNITNEPLFADGPAGPNLRLQSNSPCINAGNNAYAPAGSDLDGNPRIVGGTVDIGAYEFQNPASTISYAWLQHYGLPTDGSADFTDPDGDGMNNWQEWRCQTDPTDALSVLRLLPPLMTNNPPGGVILTWQSVAGISYSVERSTNLAAPLSFFPVAPDIPGLAGTTSCQDTNAAGPGPFFYRVVVR